MVNQSFIFSTEDRIMALTTMVKKVNITIREEVEQNKGFVYPKNRDCYGTLHANAKRLHRELTWLIQGIEKYAKVNE